jgi:thiol-disulfide isomerase/thioredoxin
MRGGRSSNPARREGRFALRSFSWIAVALLAACGSPSPPIAEPLADYEPPMTVLHATGETLVRNTGARERLILHERAPERARLLFLESRAATMLPDGRTLWPDTEGGRIAIFAKDGSLQGFLGGAPPGERALTRPLFVFGAGEEIWAVEPDGSALRFLAGAPERWLRTAGAVLMGPGPNGGLLLGRTVREFALGPVRPGEPLLRVLDPDGREQRGFGEVFVPENALLGELVNTGWVAVDRGGNVYFAAALRSELQRFDARGRLQWRSVGPGSHDTAAPRFVADGGSVRPEFAEVQHGVALGPDGRIYVLAAAERDRQQHSLRVYDSNGWLLRLAEVPAGHAIFADPDGRVAVLPPERALERVGEETRAAFPALSLPGLNVSGTLDLEAYRGKVVVANFWASWCAPCRQEMPLLDAFAAQMDPEAVVVVGLNDDARPDAARRFLRELDIRFASGAGGGRLRAQYPYPGLPYTVVLDRELRVVTVMYGFDGSIEPVRAAVEAELQRHRSAPQTHGPNSTSR